MRVAFPLAVAFAVLAATHAVAAGIPRIQPVAIENHLWNIVAYSNGRSLVDSRPGASIVFVDGRIEGRGDCGAFSGSYYLLGSTMRISAETVLADGPCFDVNLKEAQSILDALNAGERRIEQRPDRIVLRDTSGTIQVVLAPGP